MSVLGIVRGVGRLLLRTGKAELVERLANPDLAKIIAARINGKVDLPWLTEEQEQIAIKRVVRAALAEAPALLAGKR